MLNGRFRTTFNNVGQGLFYSGKIVVNEDKSFNFVYDCGTRSKREYLRTSIKRYSNSIKDNNNKKKLDLLVISHFDADHINGLETLLSEVDEMETVVLPYYTPEERLLYAIMNKKQNRFYYEFLSDPAEFLLKKYKVKKIVFIVKNGENPNKEEPVSNRSKNSNDNNLTFDINELPNGEISDKDEINEWIKEYGDKVKAKKSDRFVKIYYGYKPIWRFLFFNCRNNLDETKLEELKKYIETMMGCNDIKDMIKKVSRERSKYKELQCHYKTIANDLNDSSLIVYHTPCNLNGSKVLIFRTSVSTKKLLYCDYILCNRFLHCRREGPYTHFGQFLTGDINLKKSFNEIKTFFNDVKDDIIVSLIPHHGSYKNWNQRILEDINNCEFWITSAGLTNTYGHPSFEIFEDIWIHNKRPIWCNEFNAIVIRGEIVWNL
jgi:beta-lactamase superfamily II metal-dependent hydrolase